MQHFFIIDHNRNMFPAVGTDKQDAIERFNDTAKSAADICLPATGCEHTGYFIAPQLPDWMVINAIAGCKICAKCSEKLEAAIPVVEDTLLFNPNTHILI